MGHATTIGAAPARRVTRPAKTGQTVSYRPAGRTAEDDGGNQSGVDRRLVLLSTGAYSGTTNVTVDDITQAISNNCVKDNRTGHMWLRNPSPSVYGAGAADLLWDANTDLTTEANWTNSPGDTNLYYYATGLTQPWQMIDSDTVGTEVASPSVIANPGEWAWGDDLDTVGESRLYIYPLGGGVPTTDASGLYCCQQDKHDIFHFCDACNVAGVAGYSDWRLPSNTELTTIFSPDGGSSSGEFDQSVFPATLAANDFVWSSTTTPNNTGRANCVGIASGQFSVSSAGASEKVTADQLCMLVRG